MTLCFSSGTSVRTCWTPPLCFGTWVGGWEGGQFNSHAVNNPTSNRKDEHSESIYAKEKIYFIRKQFALKKWRPTLLRKVRKSEADIFCSGRSPGSHPTRRNLFLFFLSFIFSKIPVEVVREKLDKNFYLVSLRRLSKFVSL